MNENKKVLDEIGTQFNIDRVKSELKDRPKVWEGRQEVWETLPDSEKEKWDYVNFTDDSAIAIVTDDCEPDNPNAISSKCVYDHALIRVTQLPENPSEGDCVLYLGDNTYTYNAATPTGTENPSQEGWFEQDGTDYVLTEDTSITAGKTYYERIRGLVSGGIYEYENGEWVLKSAETTPQITLDDTLDESSNNAVKNSAITVEVNKRLVVTDTMPTASVDYVGQTRLYIGSTTANYQEGGIYKCESDGQTPPTYAWNIKNKADIDLADKQAIAQNTSDISDLQDDKQDKTLETPLTIDGTSQTTVEGALGGLNGLVSKTEKTLAIGGSASAIVKIDVSVPFTAASYGNFTEIDFQVRSDNIRFFISSNDRAYLVTAQHNYRSSGWLTGLYYLVNGSKSISLYVSILNYPGDVGAKLVFNGLDGAEITEISTVSALPSGYAQMKQFPVIYTADLTSSVTSGSTAPITAGGIYSTFQGQDATMNTSFPNYQSGFCRYVSIGAFIVGSGRIQVSEDTKSSVEIVSGLPSNSVIIPVLMYSSTQDADLGYARYEAGSITASLLKAGNNRFSFCGLLIDA